MSRQRPLRDRKTNFRLIICSHSSTDHENLANIGLVDFGLTGIVKINKYETEGLLSAAEQAKLQLNYQIYHTNIVFVFSALTLFLPSVL